MTDAHPAALRRRLTAALRRNRSRAGLTQREVAKSLGWSPSKIIRIEQGDVGISVADLWGLLRLYGVNDEAVASELEAMARESRKMPFTDFSDVVSSELLRYFRYEASASLIRQVTLTVIPGLLQTDAYAQAVFRANQVDDDKATKLLASRQQRRTLLEGEHAPEGFFIIDEGALRRLVGGPEVMGEQLDHLTHMAEKPHIKIQALTFDAGAHPALTGPFNLLEFAYEDDPDVLFIENPMGDVLSLDDPQVTASYRLRFWEIEDLAVEPADFRRFLGAP